MAVARSLLLLLVAAATTAVLVAGTGGPAEAVEALRRAGSPAHQGRPGDPFAPLVAAVALLGHLLAGYLGAVSALALAAGLPGLLGRAARACAARVTPPLLRRLLGIALSVTTAVAVGGVGTAAAAGPGSPGAGASVPALDWPDPGASAPATESPAALDWPAGAPPGAHPATAPTAHPSRPVRPAAAGVTVAAGDTLWGIAARHLPAGASDAAVARAWPTWWAANRDAVGADPDLILPGTHLAPPVPPVR